LRKLREELVTGLGIDVGKKEIQKNGLKNIKNGKKANVHTTKIQK
tara:strand:- start:268 stop:402 length:135 start_codon:yes stop_codon:yes gene_type:complete